MQRRRLAAAARRWRAAAAVRCRHGTPASRSPPGLAPATIADYRELARRRPARQLFDYIDGGAYSEHTMAANVAHLEAVGLRQRILRDVSGAGWRPPSSAKRWTSQ